MADKTLGPTFKSLIARVREPMLEPILHPTSNRLRTLALACALGHPLFYVVWTRWLPQPYESLWQRAFMSMLGFVLFTPAMSTPPPTRLAVIFVTAAFWLSVPTFFSWMYFCNGRNAAWLGTMAAMFPIYYHGMDWRIATLGSASGISAGWLMADMFGPMYPPLTTEQNATHGVIFAFSWGMSLLLGLSASNLRREQVRQALGTMGILAHELRTPLATIALIGDAVRNEASQGPAGPQPAMEQLVARLQSVVRNMNRQIDMQISNAQLMCLPEDREVLSAGQVVRSAVSAFPYRNARERECVELRVARDFDFLGAGSLFEQVVANLLKNALRALASRPEPPLPGDLVLEVDTAGRHGRIVVRDCGPGIATQVRARLFQMFASTHRGSGHGLGLAFCHRVVREARGQIREESAPGEGARFVIELPMLAPAKRRGHAAEPAAS